VTSVGVFAYRNADGSVTRELRLPEEVFSRESLETMKLKPVANEHPKEKVTSDNAEKYQVGTLGSNPSSTTQMCDWSGRSTRIEDQTDGFHVAIDMSITKAGAIEDVLNGKRALSMGYECELELAEPGAVWCGMAYDSIQRNIRYNHCAIVDAARAGDAAKIRMDSADYAGSYEQIMGLHLDSADAVLINNTDGQGEGSRPKPIQEGIEMAMKKINLDGVDYEGEEKLVQSYIDQKKRADSAESALTVAQEAHRKAQSALEAERDSFKDRTDKAEKEAKELREKALDPKRLDEAMSAKLELLANASKAGVQCQDGMTDADIKRAIVLAVTPSAKEKLDSKKDDETYLNARYDSALEMLSDNADADARQALSDGITITAGTAERQDSLSRWQKMVEDMKSQSRGQTA
jgi:hypothetical protein